MFRLRFEKRVDCITLFNYFIIKDALSCYSELEDKNQNVSKAKFKLQRVLSQVPTKGKFHIENVLDSIYFFS